MNAQGSGQQRGNVRGVSARAKGETAGRGDGLNGLKGGDGKSFKGDYFTFRMKKEYVFLAVVTLILFAIGSWAYYDLHSDIGRLRSNEDFADYATQVSNSTVLVLVRVDHFTVGDQASGAIYVDHEGQGWEKGTAFSLGNGVFLSAFHVVAKANPNNTRLIWNGQEYDNAITSVVSDPEHDFVAFKSTLNLPAVRLVNRDRAVVGERIGFVGYPLMEITPILHEGIISSSRNEQDGFFWYTINSFVNKGNSGGPVFLTGSGEVVGIISSRQGDMIQVPAIDESRLTEGEKALYQMQLMITQQLAANSQVGIGNIVGINQDVVGRLQYDSRLQ